MNTAEKIKVMQAYLDGKTIVRTFLLTDKSVGEFNNQYGGDPMWDWINSTYAVKKETIQWRAALWKDNTDTTYVAVWNSKFSLSQSLYATNSNFVRWINETQTEEIK